MSTATIRTTGTQRPKIEPFGPRDAGIPLSLDEFDAADFVPGWRYELIGGVLIVCPSPLEEERDGNEELGRLLRNYREQAPRGAALDLTLPEQNIRTPRNNRRCDRAIWAGFGRRPRTRGQPARQDAPTILVEFPSSRPADQRRDYIEKQGEYRDFGVKEYWIIDRFARRMTVFSWRGAKWVKRSLGEHATYRTPLLPGFEVPLPQLFGRMDLYADDEPDDDDDLR